MIIPISLPVLGLKEPRFREAECILARANQLVEDRTSTAATLRIALKFLVPNQGLGMTYLEMPTFFTEGPIS
jgi:hypothetical protein